MNRRWLARCDIPDLELFPVRYPNLEKLEFRAGVAMWPTMLGLGLLSGAVRAGVLKSVERLAPVLKRVAATLEPFGSGHSGMYVRMKGMDRRGRSVEKVWQLIARDNDGSDVPCMGAVALARVTSAPRAEIPRDIETQERDHDNAVVVAHALQDVIGNLAHLSAHAERPRL